MTVNAFSSLRAGTPLSSTRTAMRFVVSPCAFVGVQMNRPLVRSMLAPAGAFELRVKVNLLAGKSASNAMIGITNVMPWLIVTSGIFARMGAAFSSLTTTVKLFESVRLGTPSSATVTVMTLALGPCASPGVQVKTPLVVLMLAPAGALVPKLKVNTFAGTSGSAAVFVTTNVLPSSIN